MRILFLGDIVGKSGRDAVLSNLPLLKDKLGPDFIIIDAENSAHGYGITKKIGDGLFAAGADAVTTGDHVFNQSEAGQYLIEEPRLVRAANFPPLTPGKDFNIFEKDGKRIMVVMLITTVFMGHLNVSSPFTTLEEILKTHTLGKEVDAIFVEVHGEATSEKMALAQHFKGRVSAIIGTHTHIPTADARIFEGGTGYLTDAGMCGDYNSVIGMKHEAAIGRFINPQGRNALEPADLDGTVCGVMLNIDKDGKCDKISQIIIGPNLKNQGLD